MCNPFKLFSETCINKMFESLMYRLLNRALIICAHNPKSKECRIAWEHVENLKKKHQPKSKKTTLCI